MPILGSHVQEQYTQAPGLVEQHVQLQVLTDTPELHNYTRGFISIQLINSMAYETWRFNAAFTTALQ